MTKMGKIHIFKEGMPLGIVRKTKEGFDYEKVDHVSYLSTRPSSYINGRENYLASIPFDEAEINPEKFAKEIIKNAGEEELARRGL